MRHEMAVTAIRSLVLGLALGLATSVGALEARFNTLAAQGTGSFHQWESTPIEFTITSQYGNVGIVTATAHGVQSGTTFNLPVSSRGTIAVSGPGQTAIFSVDASSLNCSNDQSYYLVVKSTIGPSIEGSASRLLSCL